MKIFIEEKTYRSPYPVDHLINLRGDYTHLEKTIRREWVGDTPKDSEVWRLTGSPDIIHPSKELTPAEVEYATSVLFLMHAEEGPQPILGGGR